MPSDAVRLRSKGLLFGFGFAVGLTRRPSAAFQGVNPVPSDAARLRALEGVLFGFGRTRPDAPLIEPPLTVISRIAHRRLMTYRPRSRMLSP